MKAKLLILAMALISLNTMANSGTTLTCFFTEPFLTVTISNNSNEIIAVGDLVSVEGADQNLTGVINTKAKSGNIISAQFETSESRQYQLDLDLSKKGNDGMSDEEYDYEGVLNINQGVIPFIGGCNLTK